MINIDGSVKKIPFPPLFVQISMQACMMPRPFSITLSVFLIEYDCAISDYHTILSDPFISWALNSYKMLADHARVIL